MKFETLNVAGVQEAMHAMRNPMKSWAKSDSGTRISFDSKTEKWYLGCCDAELSKKLSVIGPSDRKHLRQIVVWVDITAPLYWWKEADTYTAGHTHISESTMHKIASTPITEECFEKMDLFFIDAFHTYILYLEDLRQKFNDTKEKVFWKTLIQMLPSSWLQMRTCMLSYETIHKMVVERRNHKLTEWSDDFIAWAHTLPYADVLIFFEEE